MKSIHHFNKIKLLAAVCGAVGWILFALTSFAQQETKAIFKQFSTRNGMLNNSVYGFEQGKNGLWWVATGVGLQQFDGYGFDNWNRPRIASDGKLFAANKVFEDDKGNLWVFNAGRNFVFPAGKTQYIPVEMDSLNPVGILNFAFPVMEDSERVWCFYSNLGFCGFNKTTLAADKFISVKFKNNTTENLPAFPFIGTDENGAAWITQDFEDSSFIVRFKPDEEILKSVLPVSKYGRLKAYIPLGKNRFLFLSSTYSAVCNSRDFSNPEKILSTENIPGNYIRGLPYEKLKLTNVCQIIFPGEKGIYSFNPVTEQLQLYLSSEKAKTNLSRQFMFVLKEDKWGNIWIGRDASDGLLVYFPEKLKFKTLVAPAEYFNLVYSLAMDNQGRLFAANFQKGINVFDKKGNWIKYIDLPKTENELSPSIRTMNCIENWLVMKSLYCRLLVLNTENFELTDISEQIPEQVKAQKNVFDAVLVKTGENKLRFTHGRYILQLEKKDGKFSVSLADSLENGNTINAIVFNKNGDEIIGTGNGCYIKGNNTWKLIQDTENYYIKQLTKDKAGMVWAATNHGILLLEEEKVSTVFNMEKGLLDEMIYGILFDDEGNAWYSCNRGLGCIQKNGMMRFYSENDGLQGDEFDTQSFWKGENGLLYFGGTKGISSFSPEKVLENENPGEIVLSGLQVNGVNYPENERVENLSGLRLKHNLNSLSFTFTLSNFSDAEFNVFRVKMDGFDEDWVNLGTIRSTRYHLMPGKYKFRIKGSSDGSNWSDEFELPVTIQPAWWQIEAIKWGLGFVGILLISFGIWIWNSRKTAQYKLQLSLQLEMQKERDRISRDLHDNIGSYSSALIANADDIEQTSNDSESKEKIVLLKENARNILVSIRETIWLLNSKNLTVSGFTEGFMNYCNNILRNFEGIDVEFNEEILQNRELSPHVAINLMRILQEFIQNTVKHAKASKIYFSIHSDEMLSVLISDNGTGFNSAGKVGGNGLQNIKQRASEIGFTLEINTATGAGTELKMSGHV